MLLRDPSDGLWTCHSKSQAHCAERKVSSFMTKESGTEVWDDVVLRWGAGRSLGCLAWTYRTLGRSKTWHTTVLYTVHYKSKATCDHCHPVPMHPNTTSVRSCLGLVSAQKLSLKQVGSMRECPQKQALGSMAIGRIWLLSGRCVIMSRY